MIYGTDFATQQRQIESVYRTQSTLEQNYKPYDGRSGSLDFSFGFFRELGLAIDNTAPVVVLDSRFQALSTFDVLRAHLDKG